MSKVVTLNYPIAVSGERVSEVTLRRPTVKDLKAFDREPGDINKMAVMIGRLAELAPPEVDAIDAGDFLVLSEVVDGFLSPSPPTGAASPSSSP
jgi:Phage tail assembly chaperone proteins, E, or 41 or 14